MSVGANAAQVSLLDRAVQRGTALPTLLLALLWLPGGASGSDLAPRAGGTLLYDSARDLTWLADANHAYSSGFAAANAGADNNSTGKMTFTAAQTWAAGLAVSGFTDWRLPTAAEFDPTCSNPGPPAGGVDCTGSEFGALFYSVLGGVAAEPITGSSDPDQSLFENIQVGARYWFGTELSAIPTAGYSFQLGLGGQGQDSKTTQYFVLALRDGDVGAVAGPPTSGTSELEPRANGTLLYDPVNDITWLADANHAFTSGYAKANAGVDVDQFGKMTWTGAQAWVASLDVQGIGSWRLPTTAEVDPTCTAHPASASGGGCTGSEMGSLFYTILSGVAGGPISKLTDPDVGLVKNLQTDTLYWSGTEITGTPTAAYSFNLARGGQTQISKTLRFFAIAVVDGDVPIAVPTGGGLAIFGGRVPVGLLFLSLALLGFGVARTARRAA